MNLGYYLFLAHAFLRLFILQEKVTEDRLSLEHKDRQSRLMIASKLSEHRDMDIPEHIV
jgi:hypothetical protein